MHRMSLSGRGSVEESVLEAIRMIKSQRHRPDLESICRWLSFHQCIRTIDENVITKHLALLVDKGIIVQFVKNGVESYREQKKNLLPSLQTYTRLSIANAICQHVEKSSEGLTLEEIFECIRMMPACSDMDSGVFKYHIRMHCSKAVKNGKLIRTGKFYKMTKLGRSRLLGGSKRKSETDLTFFIDRAVTDKRPATPIAICSFCFGSDETNRDGKAEELIFCVECGRSGHPSCLQFSSSLTETVKKMRWQCIECKKCSVCSDSSRGHTMLFCDSCDRGFHMDCCHPAIQRRPKGVWICCICKYQLNGHSIKRTKFLNGISPTNNHTTVAGLRRQTSQSNSDAEFDSDESSIVSEEDDDWYRRAQTKANQKLRGDVIRDVGADMKKLSPPCVEIGRYEVMTWFTSPYPDRYANLSKLFICEYCLRYMESRTILERHLTKCLLLRPPGDEIYRDGHLSVFEVDGNVAQIYCQNLCLLAKLFLDHKTLYYDVELFLFYVLTLNDIEGSHLVGYFSKEKYCLQKYNLSCIMTLPQYQRRGFGRFLIDFSYLLSRVEGRTGTPEKPLSDLGHITYQSYWKSVLMSFFETHVGQAVTIMDIGKETGICEQDIISTLQSLNLFAIDLLDRLSIVVDRVTLLKYCVISDKQKRIFLDPTLLQWTPFVSSSLVHLEESETVQELNEISRLVEDGKQEMKISLRSKLPWAKNDNIKRKVRSTSTRLNCTPLKSSKMSTDIDNRSEPTILNYFHDVSPLKSSTPLALFRPRNARSYRTELISLSPVQSSFNSKSCDNNDREEQLASCDSNIVSVVDESNKRVGKRRRGWIKGRKRGPRNKMNFSPTETPEIFEKSEKVLSNEEIVINDSFVVVSVSSSDLTDYYEIENVDESKCDKKEEENCLIDEGGDKKKTELGDNCFVDLEISLLSKDISQDVDELSQLRRRNLLKTVDSHLMINDNLCCSGINENLLVRIKDDAIVRMDSMTDMDFVCSRNVEKNAVEMLKNIDDDSLPVLLSSSCFSGSRILDDHSKVALSLKSDSLEELPVTEDTAKMLEYMRKDAVPCTVVGDAWSFGSDAGDHGNGTGNYGSDAKNHEIK